MSYPITEYNPFTTPLVTTTGIRTEKKIIKVECCTTYVNPLLLRFKNSFGGVDYVLFNSRVVDTFEAETINQYEKPLGDLYSGNKLQVTEKRNKDTYLCYRDFKTINLKGYKSLCKSELVQMYRDSTWLNVNVELTSLTLSNSEPFGKIVCKITTSTYER